MNSVKIETANSNAELLSVEFFNPYGYSIGSAVVSIHDTRVLHDILLWTSIGIVPSYIETSFFNN